MAIHQIRGYDFDKFWRSEIYEKKKSVIVVIILDFNGASGYLVDKVDDNEILFKNIDVIIMNESYMSMDLQLEFGVNGNHFPYIFIFMDGAVKYSSDSSDITDINDVFFEMVKANFRVEEYKKKED